MQVAESYLSGYDIYTRILTFFDIPLSCMYIEGEEHRQGDNDIWCPIMAMVNDYIYAAFVCLLSIFQGIL